MVGTKNLSGCQSPVPIRSDRFWWRPTWLGRLMRARRLLLNSLHGYQFAVPNCSQARLSALLLCRQSAVWSGVLIHQLFTTRAAQQHRSPGAAGLTWGHGNPARPQELGKCASLINCRRVQQGCIFTAVRLRIGTHIGRVASMVRSPMRFVKVRLAFPSQTGPCSSALR